MEKAYADLANRLTVLTGYTELFLNDGFGPVQSLQRAALESVFESSSSAQRILREARGGEASPDTHAA
jgi:hypothetical protein